MRSPGSSAPARARPRSARPHRSTTSVAPAVPRLASSCVSIRFSVWGWTASADSLRSTSATPESTGTDGETVTLSGNAVTTDSASHSLGGLLTSASATRDGRVRRREPSHVGNEVLPGRVEVHDRVVLEDGREHVAVEDDPVECLGDPPLAVLLLRELGTAASSGRHPSAAYAPFASTAATRRGSATPSPPRSRSTRDRRRGRSSRRRSDARSRGSRARGTPSRAPTRRRRPGPDPARMNPSTISSGVAPGCGRSGRNAKSGGAASASARARGSPARWSAAPRTPSGTARRRGPQGQDAAATRHDEPPRSGHRRPVGGVACGVIAKHVDRLRPPESLDAGRRRRRGPRGSASAP